ncbi:tryptophan transporter, partial [Planococcus sp. SIMBA_143]
GIFLGMKPDMMLTMMFLGIILFPAKKNVLLLGLLTGVISGLTTQFPGGFLPNLIDKPVTAFVFYGLFLATKKITRSL